MIFATMGFTSQIIIENRKAEKNIKLFYGTDVRKLRRPASHCSHWDSNLACWDRKPLLYLLRHRYIPSILFLCIILKAQSLNLLPP